MDAIFFFVFTLSGGCVLYWGVYQLQKSQQAKKWPTTQGTVMSSELTSHREISRDRNHSHMREIYKAEVSYDYAVNGINYSSNVISFCDSGTNQRSDAQNVVFKYPMGKKIVVYYNPTKPSEAILEPERIGNMLFAIMAGVVFILIGFWALWPK